VNGDVTLNFLEGARLFEDSLAPSSKHAPPLDFLLALSSGETRDVTGEKTESAFSCWISE
jgi:hypothetical protein